MPLRKSSAVWEGNLIQGTGKMKLGSGAFEGPYSFASRFEDGTGTNPEELIGAAHAGCFSMALAAGLSEAGFTPRRISTTAEVNLVKTEDGFKIKDITLNTEADVPGIGKDEFLKQAETAKANCPVSRLLTGAEIKLQARLNG